MKNPAVEAVLERLVAAWYENDSFNQTRQHNRHPRDRRIAMACIAGVERRIQAIQPLGQPIPESVVAILNEAKTTAMSIN